MTVLANVRETLKEQMTPNLAYGLAAFLVLALLYVWSELYSQRLASESRLANAQADLAAVSDVGDTDLWDQRASEAEAAKESWASRDWTGDTPGIVSAEAQARLSRMLVAAGLQSVQVSVSSDPTEIDDTLLLRFDASGVGDSQALVNLIVEISTMNKAVNLTELVAPLREQGRTRFVLGGFIPYRPSEGPGQDLEGDPT